MGREGGRGSQWVEGGRAKRGMRFSERGLELEEEDHHVRGEGGGIGELGRAWKSTRNMKMSAPEQRIF